MNTSANSSATWISSFADLSKRLAEKNIVIHSLRADWGSFGSWQLIAVKREEAIRFTYDGRDSFVIVDSSPMRNYSAPNEWREEIVKGIDNRKNEALDFCEEFLSNKFNP